MAARKNRECFLAHILAVVRFVEHGQDPLLAPYLVPSPLRIRFKVLVTLCEMPIEVMEKHRAARAAMLAKHNSAAEEAKITSGLRKTAAENGASVHHSEIRVTRETARVPETLAD